MTLKVRLYYFLLYFWFKKEAEDATEEIQMAMENKDIELMKKAALRKTDALSQMWQAENKWRGLKL
jgi:hypothetical protein